MKKIYNILLLLSVVFSYAQVSIDVHTSKKDYSENDEIIVNVILEISGQDMIQETPLRMFDTSRFNVLGSGSDQNTFIDQKNGFRVNQTLYQLVLKPKKPGRFKIGSASVVVNNKLYYTEPFDIFVAASDKKNIADNSFNDVYLNLEFENKEVFKNQPTFAVLRAYSKNFDSFRKVKNIKLPKQSNVNIRAVSYQKSEIEPAGNMASQIIAAFLIYPNESGKVEVQPFSANVSNEDNKIVSNKIKINVKNLPENAPKNYKNAVGNFKVNITNRSTEKIEINKPIHVAVKISGMGNFPSMELPQLAKSPDYTFYKPKIIKKINAGKRGVNGEIISDFVVIPKKSGSLKIMTEKFSYFEPKSQKYVDLGAETLPIDVLTGEEIKSEKTPLERMNDYTNVVLETVDNPVIKTTSLKVREEDGINWRAMWINAGLLSVALIGFLFFKNYQKKKSNNKNNLTAAAGKSLGTIEETETQIRESLKSDVDDYFAYLQKLKDEHSFEKFFKTLAELDNEIKNQYFINADSDFQTFLVKHKGQQVAENYRSVLQQIQIEKYAPAYNEEHLQTLLDSVINLYSEISK